MCREEAAKYAKQKPVLDKLGVRAVVTVKEHIPAEIEDFRTFWPYEIFLDSNKSFFKTLGGGSYVEHSLIGLVAQYLNPWSRFRENIARSTKSGTPSNFVGEGLITGGLYVVHRGRDGIGKPAYAFSESDVGDHANMEEVMDACRHVAKQASTERGGEF